MLRQYQILESDRYIGSRLQCFVSFDTRPFRLIDFGRDSRILRHQLVRFHQRRERFFGFAHAEVCASFSEVDFGVSSRVVSWEYFR